jgi:hypothetical protein
MLNVPPAEFAEFVTGDKLVHGTVLDLCIQRKIEGRATARTYAQKTESYGSQWRARIEEENVV